MRNDTYTMHDLLEDLRAHMADNGLPCPDELIADGVIHRYTADQKREKDEWYIAYQGSIHGNESIIGIYGSWSRGDKYEFRPWETDKFSQDDRARFRELFAVKQQEAAAAIQRAYEETALHAQSIWEQSAHDAPSAQYQRYADIKGISPLHSRFGDNPQGYPAMIIPLYNIDVSIQSLQYISADEQGKSYKTFLAGGKVRGNFHLLPGTDKNAEIIFVVEGYATGVSVYSALESQCSVAIALSAHNMSVVAESLKSKFPHITIVIAGDSDEAGKSAAYKAAQLVRGKTVFPSFPQESSIDNHEKKNKDFNDLHQVCGLDEVRKQLMHSNDNHDKVELNTAPPDSVKASNQEDPFNDFDVSRLPSALSEYIQCIAETTSAHPAMITGAVLAMASAFLNKRVSLKEGEYYQELYANLWLLYIAKSGQFKTTALNKGAKLALDHEEKIVAEIKELTQELQKATDDDEKKVIKDEILKKSISKVVLPSKITAEALLALLHEGHSGVVLASEFAVWLDNLAQTYNTSLKSLLTELFDVPQSYSYYTKTQGQYDLQKPYISICAVSCISWILDHIKIDDVNTGFFARFLISMPPSNDAIPSALPEKISQELLEKYRQAEQKVKATLDCVKEPRKYTLSNDAVKTFKELHAQIYAMQKQYDEKCQEILDPYVKRWSPYILKIAMIMRMFEDAESTELSSSSLDTAAMIVFSAIKSTAQLFQQELGESEHQRKCRKLHDWIVKKITKTGAPVDKKSILQSKQLPGGTKEYDYILETLADSGLIDITTATKKMDWLYSLRSQSVGKVENHEK